MIHHIDQAVLLQFANGVYYQFYPGVCRVYFPNLMLPSDSKSTVFWASLT